MRKTTLDVADLFSVLDFAGVQKRLLPLPGVGAVEMTAASSSVTVIYDQDRTDPATIAAAIKASGFHCRGETVPKHLCFPPSFPGEASQAEREWRMRASSFGFMVKTECSEAISIGVTPRAAAKARCRSGGMIWSSVHRT